MFKNIRKLTAILLASILCLTSMTTVFAEGDKGDAGEPVGVSIEEVEKLTPSSSANKNAITASPEAATVKAGETAVFTVATSGKVRSYQWQVSKNGGKTWSKLSGKTKDTLKVAATEDLNGYQYRCKVTFKDYTVVNSEPAKLTVKVGALMTEASFKAETDDYLITVSYGEGVEIPEGTEMFVTPIEYDSAEYWNYRNQALAKLNENAILPEESADEMGTRKGIAAAVFFDITLMNGDEEVQPEAAAQVSITLKNGGLPLFAGETAKVVHFGNSGMRKAGPTELIEDVEVNMAGSLADGMPEGVAADSFAYDQTGFSVVGVITTDAYINFEAAEYVPSLGDLNGLAAALLAAGGVRAAGDPTINAGKTVTDNDGDGIYELALSVQATSQQSTTTNYTKSNVVMVIDVSGSMGNDASYIYYDTYTYDASTYNTYRYYNSSTSTSTRLYYGQFRTGGYGSQVRTGWYYGGNTNNGNVYNATAYNGTVYAYETRLHATQRAAGVVVDALLAYNVNDDNITDMFEITVVKFANNTASGNNNGTEMVIRDSTSATDIKNAINALTSGGGTNWEAALNLAKTEADYYKNNDPSQMHDPEEITSVIFLTDGFPTYYLNDNGTQGGGGGENNSNIATSYTQARPSARTIVQSGYTLYSIFAFGSDTTTFNNHTGFAYIRALTNYAYGSGNTDNYNETDQTRQHAFNSKSTADLLKAFETIINHITNSVGYAGVNLTDGVSLGATSTSVAVNGTAKADSMRYTVRDAANKIVYTVKFSGNTATFTIYNAGGSSSTMTDSTPETVTTVINNTTITSSVYEVVVGSGDDAKTYKMSPATIDADTGMVKWDLAGLGILESGYTYTVAFDVWPNQLAYDIAADLNNGIYASVDAALDAYGVTDDTERKHIKDAIVKNDDGSYSLYTNYEQGVEYYPATSQTDDSGNTTWTYGDKQTQPIPQPDPVPLQGSLLPLKKEWESGLSMQELNEILWKNGEVGGESLKYHITLYVWMADTREALDALVNGGDITKAYITEVLGWDETVSGVDKYVFEKDAAVSPGTMVNLDEAAELGFDITDTSKIRVFTNAEGAELEYYVIEEGHYYYVTESGSDLHFELETELYHPMIVDGTLYNVFFGPRQTVERMDPMYAVVATNVLKGGLNIRKEVSSTQIPDEYKKITVNQYDENGKIIVDGEGNPVTKEVDDIIYTPVPDCTDEFAFKITIWRLDDNGAIKPVYTYDDQFEADYKAISGSIGYREFGVDAEGEFVTLGRNVIVFEDTPNAAAKLEANRRGDNDPVYATKTSDGKTQIILRMPANGEIRLVNLPTGTFYTVEEIIDEDGPYKFAATKSEIKYDDEKIQYVGVGRENLVSGKTIGNTAEVETFYNWAANFYVYHSSTNKIEKISFADERVKGKFDAEKGEYTYTFNIVDETAENFLYGGYYKKYAGAVLTDEQIVAGTYTADANKKLWLTDEGATPYDAKTANVWKKANAYTDDATGATGGGVGTEMTPVGGIVYYLKEVPNGYIRPYIHFTYDERDPELPLKKLYVITASDDANYDSVGYATNPGTDEEAITSSTKGLTVTIKKPDGTIDATLTVASVFGNKTYHGETVKLTRGYLWLTDLSKQLGSEFTYQPCWNTLDKVLVKGYTIRTVNGGTNFVENDPNCIGVEDVAANP